MAEELTKDEYEAKIAELEEQLKEAQTGDFEEIKAKYQKVIDDKDTEIQKLKEENNNQKKKIDDKVGELNNEVEEHLKQTEAYKNMVEKIQQLEKEKAEVSAETVIRKGLALPVQKDTLIDWAFKNPESFDKYFENAQPVIELEKQKSKKINADITRLRDYFKN